MDIRYRGHAAITLLATVLACLISISAFAQDDKKLASDKWRPKDGFYIVAGTEVAGMCEESAQYFFELSKKKVTDHVSFGCSVTKIYDTAPGALRLDLSCVDVEGSERRTKEVMSFRRINEKSFFMRMSNKGRFDSREFQVDYCPETPADKWPTAFEIARDAVRKQLKTAEWQPRSGVYASPGPDFDDRCTKSADAVIELEQISVSSGVSHCVISSIDSSTPASIRMEARCDLKPGQTGLVVRSKGGQISFAPVGSEQIIITSTGNQTLTLQKTQNGALSEPAQALAYCPDAAQRAYADSRKK